MESYEAEDFTIPDIHYDYE